MPPRPGAAARAALREQLRREALPLGDALDLDRDRVDRLLHALEPRRHVRPGSRAAGSPCSIRFAYARASGHPIADDRHDRDRHDRNQVSADEHASSPRCTRRFHREEESDRRSVACRALRLHRAVVREQRLPHDRQSEPGAARLVRDVRLPDARQPVLRNARRPLSRTETSTIGRPFSGARRADTSTGDPARSPPPR